MIITWPIQDHVKARTAAAVLLALPRLLFLAFTYTLVLGSELYVDPVIAGVVAPALAVAIITARSAIIILHPGCAGVLVHLLLSSPCIFFGRKISHHIHKGHHALRLCAPHNSSELLVLQTMLECGDGLDIGIVNDFVFLLQESDPECVNRFASFLYNVSQVATISRLDIHTLEVGDKLGLQVVQAGDRFGR